MFRSNLCGCAGSGVEWLRAELADDTDCRGAFSRFRREVNGYEPLCQAWFEFRDVRARKRMRDWLAIERYKLVEDE